jgi:hypothetical protein
MTDCVCIDWGFRESSEVLPSNREDSLTSWFCELYDFATDAMWEEDRRAHEAEMWLKGFSNPAVLFIRSPCLLSWRYDYVCIDWGFRESSEVLLSNREGRLTSWIKLVWLVGLKLSEYWEVVLCAIFLTEMAKLWDFHLTKEILFVLQGWVKFTLLHNLLTLNVLKKKYSLFM